MQELFLMGVQNTCDNNSVEHSLSIKFSHKWDIQIAERKFKLWKFGNIQKKSWEHAGIKIFSVIF
jgi:hypothetical protein